MKYIIAGGSGLIGKALAGSFSSGGNEVIVLTRNPHQTVDNIKQIFWDGKTGTGWNQILTGEYIIINLAGENISNGRWTKKRKSEILNSRLDAINAIYNALKNTPEKPKCIIQASAIGFYSNKSGEPCTETSQPGSGFLSWVVQKMELSAKRLQDVTPRLVIIRTGVVLSENGGALPKIIKPLKLMAGGIPGTGRQWYSWIHISDLVEIAHFIVNNDQLNGIINLVAPNPVTVSEFIKVCGKTINRKVWLNYPPFILKLLFGEMAESIILNGERVAPEKLLNAGYPFKFPDIQSAINDLLISEK